MRETLRQYKSFFWPVAAVEAALCGLGTLLTLVCALASLQHVILAGYGGSDLGGPVPAPAKPIAEENRRL